MGRDAPPHLFHEREIRGPILTGGSPDRNENRQAGFHSLSEIGGEGQPPFRQPFADQFGQSRFVNGNLALIQLGDPTLVRVHAGHMDPELGETGSCHQSHVAGANDADIHTPSACRCVGGV